MPQAEDLESPSPVDRLLAEQPLDGPLELPARAGEELPPDAAATPPSALSCYDELGLLVQIEPGTTSWYVGTDHLGSPRLVVDASGNTVRRIAYDAWGRETIDFDAVPSLHLPIGFAGGLRDATTGPVRW